MCVEVGVGVAVWVEVGVGVAVAVGGAMAGCAAWGIAVGTGVGRARVCVGAGVGGGVAVGNAAAAAAGTGALTVVCGGTDPPNHAAATTTSAATATPTPPKTTQYFMLRGRASPISASRSMSRTALRCRSSLILSRSSGVNPQVTERFLSQSPYRRTEGVISAFSASRTSVLPRKSANVCPCRSASADCTSPLDRFPNFLCADCTSLPQQREQVMGVVPVHRQREVDVPGDRLSVRREHWHIQRNALARRRRVARVIEPERQGKFRGGCDVGPHIALGQIVLPLGECVLELAVQHD